MQAAQTQGPVCSETMRLLGRMPALPGPGCEAFLSLDVEARVGNNLGGAVAWESA